MAKNIYTINSGNIPQFATHCDDWHWGRSMGTLQIQGQPQGIAPTNRSDVGAILYACPSVIS